MRSLVTFPDRPWAQVWVHDIAELRHQKQDGGAAFMPSTCHFPARIGDVLDLVRQGLKPSIQALTVLRLDQALARVPVLRLTDDRDYIESQGRRLRAMNIWCLPPPIEERHLLERVAEMRQAIVSA